jgi:hypothetical protein
MATNMATTCWLLRTFGERQMMALPIARRWLASPWLASPLINKEFGVCHPPLTRGNFASVTLNHQKWPRADLLYAGGGFHRLT